MPGGEKSLELLHKAQKVILHLTDIITTFSLLGYIPKLNKQVKEAQPKINDQLCGHEGENFWLIPSPLLQENWSPTPPLRGHPAKTNHIFVRTVQNHEMCELPVLRVLGYIQPQMTA